MVILMSSIFFKPDHCFVKKQKNKNKTFLASRQQRYGNKLTLHVAQPLQTSKIKKDYKIKLSVSYK